MGPALRILVGILCATILGTLSPNRGRLDASPQRGIGTIAGTVRDESDGVLPGATITVIGATGESRKAVSDQRGQYQVTDLSDGTYRVEFALVGFRRTVLPNIRVFAGQEAKCDAKLRVSPLAIVDYVDPGLAELTRSAAAILHFRVVQPLGTRLQTVVMTEQVVDVIGVAKAPDAVFRSGQRIHIWQSDAGRWKEDEDNLTGRRSPYLQGEEFVGFFQRAHNGLVEMVGGQYTSRVIDGRVRYTRRPAGGVRNNMTLSDFFQELKKLGGG